MSVITRWLGHHLLVLQKPCDLFDAPNVVGNPGFHRRSDAQTLVNPAEVIVHVVQRDGPKVIIHFLAKRIG